MILVDSCVWIDLLQGNTTPAVKRLKQIQEKKSPEICVSSIIFFEVLRGISSDLDRKRVRGAFDLLEKRDYENDGFDRLVEHSQLARDRGFSLKKMGDWLIFKTVLDHSLTLLTSDKDFFHLHKIIPFSLES